MLSKRPILFQECYLLFPKEEEIVQILDKIKVRKIFEGQVEFDIQELHILADFEQFLKSKQFKQIWSDSMKLRMLYATKFKFDKTLAAMLAYMAWKSSSLPPVESSQALQFLSNGAIYLHGRDNRFRPIIFVNATKLANNQDIQITLDALTIFLEYVIQNYMLPGQIENWVVLMDLGGLGITSLPRQQLQRVLAYLQNNYRSRMHKCYVVNCPGSITFSWNIIKGFLEEITVRKISFEGSGIAQPLFQHCHPSQVELKYGGTAPNLSNNYWPPFEVSQQYFLQSENPDQILITKAQYHELYQFGKLSKNKICQELIGDINQSIQKTTLEVENKLKKKGSAHEDTQFIIDNILFQYRNEYLPREIDEYQVNEQESTCQLPLFLRVNNYKKFK